MINAGYDIQLDKESICDDLGQTLIEALQAYEEVEFIRSSSSWMRFIERLEMKLSDKKHHLVSISMDRLCIQLECFKLSESELIKQGAAHTLDNSENF